MKNCVLCGNKAGWFSKKSYNGYVCKECVSLIRRNMLVKLFQPDIGSEFASDSIISQINEAFKIFIKK